jgi:hypothetical protein
MDFELFISHSFNNKIKLLDDVQLRHLHNIRKLCVFFLSEHKTKELCNLIIKVGKKNPEIEKIGNRIFFNQSKKENIIDFISLFMIDVLIHKKQEEFLGYKKEYADFKTLMAISSR